MDRQDLGLYFVFFNEIGIIEQLIRALLEAKLPKGFLISHFSVLNHLIRVKDGQTPLVISRAFQVPKTTMTHTLSILERHALIDRLFTKCPTCCGDEYTFAALVFGIGANLNERMPL